MEIKEINELTHNWTADEFADFLHYLLQHGNHESMRGWWRSTSLLRKLEAAGLAELDGGEVALTPSGSKLRDALYLLEESDGLADARLNLRVHRLEDRHAAPLGADTLMLLVAGRSGRVRADAARMLMEDEGGRTYADRLAKCWDPKVRILAAPYADPHLFLNETDHDVIEAVIKGGRADDVCRERWTSPDEPFEIRLAAGALVTDGERADRMLDAMEPDERVMFLGAYPRLAVGERVRERVPRDRRRGTARILHDPRARRLSAGGARIQVRTLGDQIPRRGLQTGVARGHAAGAAVLRPRQQGAGRGPRTGRGRNRQGGGTVSVDAYSENNR